VGVLIRKGYKYLLIKRAAEPDKGLWSVPGGLVEIGEKAVDAAVREAKEETALDVELIETLGVVDKIVKDESGKVKYHFVIIDYLAEPIGGEMYHHDDALDARWINPKDFKKYDLSPTLVELLIRINLYN
jgi:ADP-ribose pyrophosphatase